MVKRMSEDYLKEIKERNENFETENQEPVEANYTITNEQNSNPDPAPSFDFKESTEIKKPRSFKMLFIVLGVILLIAAIAIGFSLLQKTDVDLNNPENTTNLTDTNSNVENLTDLENTDNLDSNASQDQEQDTGINNDENLSEIETILLNCQPYTQTKEVENFLSWPSALVKLNYEYNIIGLTESNECEIEQKITDMEYKFDKNQIIEHLDNPENKLKIFTNTAFMFGLDSNFPDINEINDFSEIESDVDNLIIQLKESVISYYDSLSEEDWTNLKMLEESINLDGDDSNKDQKITCYVSNKSYIPKLIGISEKSSEEIIANMKSNQNIDLYINSIEERADYDWGYCIQQP